MPPNPEQSSASVFLKHEFLHPLDPLTPFEISETSKIIRAAHPNRKLIFNSITLLEPRKADVLKYIENEDKVEKSGLFYKNEQIFIPRRSSTLLIERFSGKVFETIVNLTESKIEKFIEHPSGNQPTFTIEESLIVEDIVRKDVGVQKRCAKLGIHNMDNVVSDPWVICYDGLDEKFHGRRILQAFMYTRTHEGENYYAHPLDFAPVIDLGLEEVVLIEDLPCHNSDFMPKKGSKFNVSTVSSNYDFDLHPNDFLRKDVKPLQVVQPKGPSFTIKGNELSWQKFKIRIGFNYREGLVLHNISYKDGDKVRPLIYRASLAEMIVPYGDPRPVYHRKCAFDVGEYGLGICANSLKLGCDCLGSIKYLDGIINNHAGEPNVIKNAICIHEEDAGLLFKHTEFRTNKATVARSRKLVISFIATIANYEYAFYWNFYQDATINFDIKATGIISTTPNADGDNESNWSTQVLPGVNGQYHQHIYCMRLDTMFDGPLNTVSSVDVVPLKGKIGSIENPFGQGFSTKVRPIKSTEEGVSDSSSETSRFWIISNPNSVHETTKKPVSWKLYPGNAIKLMAQPGSHIYEQAGFARHAIWVTKYDEKQLYPAGNFINTTNELNGLAEWIQEKKNTENEDIVLWHTFGTSHIIRVEDFPIMPVESCGFTLKPYNFFKCNPALDVPPPDRKENKSIYVSGQKDSNNSEKSYKNGTSEINENYDCCKNIES